MWVIPACAGPSAAQAHGQAALGSQGPRVLPSGGRCGGQGGPGVGGCLQVSVTSGKAGMASLGPFSPLGTEATS